MEEFLKGDLNSLEDTESKIFEQTPEIKIFLLEQILNKTREDYIELEKKYNIVFEDATRFMEEKNILRNIALNADRTVWEMAHLFGNYKILDNLDKDHLITLIKFSQERANKYHELKLYSKYLEKYN